MSHLKSLDFWVGVVAVIFVMEAASHVPMLNWKSPAARVGEAVGEATS